MIKESIMRYKSINTKMNTIKRLVVFILVFIFMYILANTIVLEIAYADPDSTTNSGVKCVIVSD